ncbi:hypothetical protein PMAYCL1PPCAC_19334 [Pristionchus mayeri]|uniref:Uncharacterized protein n=1 Tax=Pristionchus mayeri TaxID=1317129 RepID=A0AAN5I2C8_9BILA|nr:hypothetical protein PMAYCL1PPCAC_19334 [Pristionchus mayeri]
MRIDVCCCGLLSVTHGSRLLSLLTIAGGLFVVYNSTCRSRSSTTVKTIGVIVGLCLLLTGCLAIHAVKARKPRRMMPIIGVQAILLLIFLLYIAAFIFAFVKMVEISICVILSVGFLIALWFFSIHFNTYRYLKEFESKGFGPSAVDSYGV